MKFLKKNIKFIAIFVIGMIIGSTVSVYAAYSYLAQDVSYTKSDGTEISVKEALDQLYAKNPGSIPAPTTINYTGYYADVNDAGTPDGLILTDNQTGTAYALNSNGYVIKTGSGSRFLLMRTQDWSTSSTWDNAVGASETIGSTRFSLPSLDNLQKFYGHGLWGYYWSSTERNSYDAYRVNMDIGSMGYDTKNYYYKVRLCATF